MTLYDMKKKVLALIEELNPESEYLTDDPDIQAKINAVCNQVLFEMCRIKKIPKYLETEVTSGDYLMFDNLEAMVGYPIYQIIMVKGVEHEMKASGTVIKFLSSGNAEIELYVYPERIPLKGKDKAYEFEVPDDVLEIMPYGIAADLLKSDVSAEYGSVYATRYEQMKNMLDPRYQMPMYTYEGGVDIP